MIAFFVKNCRVSVSFFFAAAAALLLAQDKNGVAALTFLAAALHESGHYLVMLLFGVQLSQIRVTPFGIDIEKSQCAQRSYQRDALVSFAGPLANLTIAAIFSVFSGRFSLFVNINLLLALFNLLPIEPLDGGQALYSLLCIRFSSERSARVVSMVSFAVLTPLALFGFLLLLRSPWNFSLLVICVYLMILLVFKSGRYY